ncbi:MAG: sodium:solute symporter family protein [candidate division KSB1 bacterium]|nr:sodium:solute symporter family protein [candidate division KSB1 bacterium]MDZ7340202.1 sodium:solute symporter family protein [candidate division KSB1 bacterium]
MNVSLYLILAYLLILMGFNFYRSKKVKTQDDMMVAGRSLSVKVMVFTLICTWIGSGTFIAGAEFAAKAGWSALWLPAGAWFGIVVIYFLAAKIRTFGKYTIGDILEVRYGKFARLFGAVALIISFTAIVSYQFKAGGYILNVVSDQAISVETGQFWAALFVIVFTATAGMMAVAYTDLPNGIIILLACLVATPIVVYNAGGVAAMQQLPADHLKVINQQFGEFPVLKAISYFLATLLLLMGVQSMYQKFYSAKTPKDARSAVALWVVGTIFVETVVVVIAVFAASKYWPQIQAFLNGDRVNGIDPASIVIQAARGLMPPYIGILLIAAACAVVISTGMNYLLSPTTNIMRDIYQQFINRQADQKTMVALQKILIVVIGVVAFLLCTKLKSVLEMSYFAYTIYGVAITPALIAALAWKRATKAGGLASIIGGSVVALGLYLAGFIWPSIMIPYGDPNGDPFGIPLIYPAFFVSLAALIIGSYLTKPPKTEEIKELFPDEI